MGASLIFATFLRGISIGEGGKGEGKHSIIWHKDCVIATNITETSRGVIYQEFLWPKFPQFYWFSARFCVF